MHYLAPSSLFVVRKAWLVVLALGLLGFLGLTGLSQAADTNLKTDVKSVSIDNYPRWAELTEAQKRALSPLENLWPTLEANRKRKWLAIAQNFADLSESSQALAQERMREWAALSPLERTQARLNFAKTQQLSSDEKLAKWEAFQALSDEDKQKIPSSGQIPPKGAALAVKPMAANKLANTPVKKEGQATTPRIDTGQLNPFTLLPAHLQATPRPLAVQ